MADILHRVFIKTTPDKLYDAVASQDGLRAWWTPMTATGGNEGDTIEFRFGDGSMGPDMKITKLTPGEFVGWDCVGGDVDDWIGTTYDFIIRPHNDGALLLFAQRGWKEAGEFFMHCNSKWGFFLGTSLKKYLETGTGMPHPEDPDL